MRINKFVEDFGAIFHLYHCRNLAWGSLHIILADGNLNKRDVIFCINYAYEEKDFAGMNLAFLLTMLSKRQLKKIYKKKLL